MVEGEPGLLWKTRWPENAGGAGEGRCDGGRGVLRTARAPPRAWDGRGVWGPHIVIVKCNVVILFKAEFS
jgi:hypothetical protein